MANLPKNKGRLIMLRFSKPFIAGLIALLAITHGTAQSSSAQGTAQLQLVAEGYKFTEGPAADKDGNLFFTDQPNDRILRLSTEGEITTWMQPAGRSNGLFFAPDGRLIACADGENQLWAIAPDKTHTVLLTGYKNRRFNGPNDVWVDADGSFFFSDPYYERPYWQHAGQEPKLPHQVYRLAAHGKSLTVAAADFKQPNGIVGDREKRLLYVADIGDKKTYRFTISDSGKLTDRQLFCDMGSDGMTLDAQGNLYLTGKGVTVFNAAGQKIEHIDVPEKWTSNVCFGGSDHKTLFITASDSLYSLKRNVRGL